MATTNLDRQSNTLTRTGHRAGCGDRQILARARSRYELDDEALATLRDNVLARRVVQGLQWIEENGLRLSEADSDHPNMAPLLGYLSQWSEYSTEVLEAVRKLLALFPLATRDRLRLNACAHLRMAEGVVDFADGDAASAGTHFDFIIGVESHLGDPALPALAHFWKALCDRDRGDFDAALEHATRSRAIWTSFGYPPSAAVMRALEGSLLVEKGRFARATELLWEAEVALGETTDWTWRGNIQAAYGRIAQEEGRYALAAEHFAIAVSHYRVCNPRHTSLPEALAGLAHVQRLLAVRTEKAIDLRAERRRRSAQSDWGGCVDPGVRQNVDRLRQEAGTNLKCAVEMFDFLGRPGKAALARVELGLLYTDRGQFDRAGSEAVGAFEIASRSNDYLAMGYARLLQSRIENAQYEEGIGDSPATQAQRARDFAQEAVAYAAQTQDRRLLASAYIGQGLVFCNDFFNNTEAAGECCLRASDFLNAGNRTHLWDEHQRLRRKVAREGPMDARLREWSQGLVHGKTFQQLTEEFAELVIPSVWEREGRNVSRVVAKLSISPKKVRRILIRAGVRPVMD